jgi:hypothetical protein
MMKRTDPELGDYWLETYPAVETETGRRVWLVELVLDDGERCIVSDRRTYLEAARDVREWNDE